MTARTLLVAVLAGLVLSAGGTASPSAERPANGRIVFATDDGMASINQDGSGAWGLRFTRIGRHAPAWSPDGSAIAFTEADGRGIFVMDPDGTEIRPLVERPGATNAAWSPDGRRIAFDDGGLVFTANADGTGVASVAAGTWPTWSSDGSAIAFEADGDIRAVDLGTGAVRSLTSGPAWDIQPEWSPGTTILFASDRDGVGTALYETNATGTSVKRISVGGAYDAEPTWAPHGNLIAFTRNGQVWTSDVNGSGARQLVHGNAWSGSPAWQPLPPNRGSCTYSGTDANDLLIGTDRSEILCGYGGDDTVIGLGGHDVLRGGGGSDWIAGGLGRDFHFGGAGPDRIDARDGEPDRVDAGEDRDAVVVDAFGGATNDSVRRAERTTLSTNVSAWRPTTASNAEATNPSVMAVDGRIDDYWSSGRYPAQWIEVDLQRPTRITQLRVVTPDLPEGVPVLVLGRSASPSGTYRLLHTFEGPTVFRQELRFTPRTPRRNVQFVRLHVPVPNTFMGWVSWPEIAIHSHTR